jgi:hypothetical protein
VMKVSRGVKLGRRVAANLSRRFGSIRESCEGLTRSLELPIELLSASPWLTDGDAARVVHTLCWHVIYSWSWRPFIGVISL